MLLGCCVVEFTRLQVKSKAIACESLSLPDHLVVSHFEIWWASPAVNLKPSSIAALPSSQKVLARPRWQQAMTPRDYAACDAVDREPREPLTAVLTST